MGEIVDLESYRAERLRRLREERKRKDRRKGAQKKSDEASGGTEADPAKDEPV
ncbi:hypothetical protein HBA54_08255 [Pelagibius litoralis]|uniref:Uncharacterized protein n=1 Tax=Pelagibius litoralis TaxID=374515 RepID=A0A967C228_9PROT|nr:hypothetical protein [Pelagibius litoralis]NIA68581.1 hypothetical protein [Pelagibius litoralis]